MKKLLTVLLLLLAVCFAYGQTENPESKYATGAFKKYYNNSRFDSIFSMFSASTKVNLPLEKTMSFLNQLKSKYGNVMELTFQEYKDGFGVYKSAFQKDLLILSIAVNKNREIIGLYARPYEESIQPGLKETSLR
jgi:hypothetical protein